MAEDILLEDEPKVEQEGAISLEEAIELAEAAIANIKPEMQAGEVFPGSNAYEKVMRVMVMTEPGNKVIDNWHDGYDDMAKKFDTTGTYPESFEATNTEKFVADLRSMLEGALASAQRKLSQGAEREQNM